MKKIRIVSTVILLLTLLNIFAFMIVYVHNGGQELGVFTGPIRSFSEFPSRVYYVIKELYEPERLIKTDPEFRPINKLDYDVYALNGHFGSNKKWNISLINLRNDSVIHEWFLDESHYKNSTGRGFSHSEPRGPILLQDKSIIFTSDESFNLYKLDKESNVVWHNTDAQYHHSINLSQDGNIWACTKEPVLNQENASMAYWNNSIVKININTGKTVFKKSIEDILIQNGLLYLIHGVSNKVGYSGDDPLHLNDIEPVLSDGPFWQKGDVFLSFRNRSLIFLYRPETDKLIRIIHGPFYNQHDIDIQSDSTISLFNNNVSGYNFKMSESSMQGLQDSEPGTRSLINTNAEVLIYNLQDSTFVSYLPEQFKKEKILTHTEGLHEILSNGDLFVEDQNNGPVYIFNKKEIVLKKYYNKPVNGLVERPHWVRIYESLNFLKN